MDKLTGHGRPHPRLVGAVGQHYEDVDTGDVYECRLANEYSTIHGAPVGGYVWELRAKGEDVQEFFGAGGSGGDTLSVIHLDIKNDGISTNADGKITNVILTNIEKLQKAYDNNMCIKCICRDRIDYTNYIYTIEFSFIKDCRKLNTDYGAFKLVVYSDNKVNLEMAMEEGEYDSDSGKCVITNAAISLFYKPVDSIIGIYAVPF